MHTSFDHPAQANIIELTKVGQSYDGGQNWIIKDCDLLIEDKPDQGQFVVILGMSGSGKSTILRYIAGLQEPTTGDLRIQGKSIQEAPRVSMVFQQYSSLPWMTVLDNVSLALRYQGVTKSEREDQARILIEKVGLSGQEHKYAQYPGLSGGQLQRVAIARSLIANPSILLMDEPFGALDIRTRLNMQDLLTNIWREFQSTIVFVTHDISEAVYLADDIYILGKRPSRIARHIPITLPIERSKAIKRSPEYTALVHEVEDAMMDIAM
ncbi:MAG: ABC transporter ATP-binding protein [Bacteroidota bacterium]